jgi:hypothetical protein
MTISLRKFCPSEMAYHPAFFKANQESVVFIASSAPLIS